MKTIPSFLISTHARADLTRIAGELADLQRQTASSNKADDLKGYGSESARIVSARTAIAQSNARVDAARRVVTRFELQDTALGAAASAAAQLKQDIFTALSSDNGGFLAGQLDTAFQQATDALNTTYQGVSLFSGERRDAAAVSVAHVGDVRDAQLSGTLFHESARKQTVDIGAGAPVVVADKGSEVGTKLYEAFANLNDLTRNGGLGNPLTTDQRNRLLALASDIDAAHTQVVDAQGRNGDAQAHVEASITRLSIHADLLTKHLGALADADLAEVALKLAAAQTQYQATASVFSKLKDLSLVNFLN